ncbi:MAG TPA: PH domain-containing protein [Bacillota bacterium]|nr:PH domain-containing protein [Bacillota bacterium]
MLFRSKRDRSFIILVAVGVGVIAVVTLIPMFLEGDDLIITLTLLGIFLLSSSFILWASFAIKYVFYDDYLYVKGGPFRSKIPYDKITKVRSTSNMMVGYRILSSADAIEIYYQTALLGSVKISPKEKKAFIMQLKKRCPQLEVSEELEEKL